MPKTKQNSAESHWCPNCFQWWNVIDFQWCSHFTVIDTSQLFLFVFLSVQAQVLGNSASATAASSIYDLFCVVLGPQCFFVVHVLPFHATRYERSYSRLLKTDKKHQLSRFVSPLSHYNF